MFLDTEIRDSAYQFFIQEAIELLQTIEEGLITLRGDRTTANVHNVMRAAHSIKGGAASVELNGIKDIAHQLEDAFRALYHEDVVIDLVLEELLLQGFDSLRSPLMQQIQTGSYNEAEALAHSQPVFEALFAILGDPNSAEFEMPTSAELGVDIVEVVFESDVADGISRLQSVLANPTAHEVSGEVRAQAEVFAGIGELLNLPGFVAIAKATTSALDAHPDFAAEIGFLAASDFQAALTGVLAGDRTQGGTPSADLVELGQENVISGSATEGQDIANEDITESGFGSAFSNLNSMFGFGSPGIVGESDQISSEIADSVPEAVPETMLNLEGFNQPYDRELFQLAERSFTEMQSHEALSDLDLDSDWHEAGDIPIEEAFTEDISSQFTEFPPTEAPIEAVSNLDLDLDSDSDWHEAGDIPIEETFAEENINSQLATISTVPTDRSEHPPLQVTGTTEISGTVTGDDSGNPSAQSRTNSLQSIRVDLNRLERLNNLAGELVIQENSTSLQNQQLQGKLQTILKQFSKFEVLAEGLQNWADRNQSLGNDSGTSPSNSQSQSQSKLQSNLETSTTELSSPVNDTTFDLLELDSYSNLYSLVQAAVEEMAQIGESVRDVTQITKQAEQLTRKKQQTLKQVRDDLLWSRMLPLRDILHRFPRMIRDLGTQAGKEVTLKMVGVSTLIDKAILEKLYDPLVHLLRNAFDHGIEAPHLRIAQGKPAAGTIEIRAYHRGNQTYIEVRDDGQGINIEKVMQRAITMNLLPPAEVAIPVEKQLYDCLFAPGFSTAAQVSKLSGRGMGLDAVQIQVKGLKGAIAVMSEPGKGTTFTIRLPLTLSIAKLLVFTINSRMLAIPIDSLVAINNVSDNELQTVQNQRFYPWEDELVPVCPRSLLSYRYAAPSVEVESDLLKTMSLDNSQKLLLISHGNEVIALEADSLIAEQEFAIKPFGSAIAPPPYLYGCTILGDGRLVPVIDGAALVTHWLQPEIQQKSIYPSHALPTTELSAAIAPTILVVDDSLTMRQTLTLTLQKHGYRSIQARDGREALEQIQQNANIQAVLCDIEMPQMNGFEFLTNYRARYSDRDMPIIMLTTRSSAKHRQFATYLGAKAYLTKPFLEQELLQTLQSFLKQEVAV